MHAPSKIYFTIWRLSRQINLVRSKEKSFNLNKTGPLSGKPAADKLTFDSNEN